MILDESVRIETIDWLGRFKNFLLISTAIFIAPAIAGEDCATRLWGEGTIERFVAVDDGRFVKDRQTGLVWQRCSLGQIWVEGRCLERFKRQVQSWFSWEQALGEALLWRENHGAEWRLPNRYELSMLADRRCGAPTINRLAFPDTPSANYWTADAMSTTSDYAWLVDFAVGKSRSELKSTPSYHVRLVKGNEIREVVEFSEAGSANPHDDGIHDLSNPELGLLQLLEDATKDFPLDERGNINWVKAMKERRIHPRSELRGGGNQPVWEHSIVYNDTQTMPPVVFPHKIHSEWLSCDNCHDRIFSAKTGSADISMRSIYSGEYCGRCHGTVAFSPHSCERCHLSAGSADSAGSGAEK